ncbi:hypothetical protein HYR69_06065, partial [Candidatus Sumerlaeota bacterium]|nr:hypothetical protein [Candidatus Sumerlaeota bacterium]
MKKQADELRSSGAKPSEADVREIEDRKKKIAELEAQIAQAKEQIEKAKSAMEDLKKEIAEIGGRLDESKRRQSETEAKLSAIERSLKILNILAAGAENPPAIPDQPKKDSVATIQILPPEKKEPPKEQANAEVKAKEQPQPVKPAEPAAQPAPAQPVNPAAGTEGEQFFETKVRPILAENCFSCHGPQKQKANLRLDSLAAVLKGGDDGAVIVPGDPEQSLMIKAIRYDGEIKMPPKEKLPQEAIDHLTQWVKMGAPWAVKPKADDTLAAAPEKRDPKKHWAFLPVGNPAPPETRDAAWPANPVDQFILAKLEAG